MLVLSSSTAPVIDFTSELEQARAAYLSSHPQTEADRIQPGTLHLVLNIRRDTPESHPEEFLCKDIREESDTEQRRSCKKAEKQFEKLTESVDSCSPRKHREERPPEPDEIPKSPTQSTGWRQAKTCAAKRTFDVDRLACYEGIIHFEFTNDDYKTIAICKDASCNKAALKKKLYLMNGLEDIVDLWRLDQFDIYFACDVSSGLLLSKHKDIRISLLKDGQEQDIFKTALYSKENKMKASLKEDPSKTVVLTLHPGVTKFLRDLKRKSLLY